MQLLERGVEEEEDDDDEVQLVGTRLAAAPAERQHEKEEEAPRSFRISVWPHGPMDKTLRERGGHSRACSSPCCSRYR